MKKTRLIKSCRLCGKAFFTEYPTKLYCSLRCARAAYFEREESDFQGLPVETDEPLLEFECAECGKTVRIYSRYDQRVKYCCGKCAKQFRNRRAKEKRRKDRADAKASGMSGVRQ